MSTSVLDRAATTSVDVITLRYRPDANAVEVAVAPRPWKPYKGQLALPGVLLLKGERLATAAARSLAKLGIDASKGVSTGQCMTFDEPARDPRGPSLSLAMWATPPSAEQGSPETQWFDLDAVPSLAFDHSEIITACRPILSSLLWRDAAFTAGLTGSTFSSRDAAAITRSLTGQEPDRGNLNRLLSNLPGLNRGGVSTSAVVGRPPVLWTWAD